MNLIKLVILTSCAFTIIPSLALESIKDSTSQESVVITVPNTDPYFIVECNVNGRLTYFLVDTGATYTILHRGSAKSLGCQFTRRDNVRYHGFGEPGSAVEIAVNVVMEIADKEINMNFVAQDLFKMRKTLFDEFRIYITGIIGSDLLKILGARVDLESNVLRFR